MNVYIVTEGADDEAILKAILSDPTKNQNNYRIVSAGGKSSAESYARSLLATGKGPVALVVDADTTEEWRSNELQRALDRSLSEVASGSDFKVIVIRPEIESLLFLNRELLSDIGGDIDEAASARSPRSRVPTSTVCPTGCRCCWWPTIRSRRPPST